MFGGMVLSQGQEAGAADQECLKVGCRWSEYWTTKGIYECTQMSNARGQNEEVSR